MSHPLHLDYVDGIWRGRCAHGWDGYGYDSSTEAVVAHASECEALT